MGKLLDRILGRRPRRRGLEAAGGGRRWDGSPWTADQNAAILAGSRRVGMRAAAAVMNNPHAASAARAHVASVIGAGNKPRPVHPNEGRRERLAGLWEGWTDQSDAAGLTDFYGLQALAERTRFVEGECFVRLLTRPDGPAGRVPFQLEILHPDQVPMDLHQDLAQGGRIRAGIEFDAAGRRVAYHVYRRRPGDGIGAIDTVRVPAADMLHVFEPLVPGQVRGVSVLAPVLLRLADLDGYQDAELMAAKVRALFAGFIRDVDGTAAGLADGAAPLRSVLDVGLEPGTLSVLPPGADISFSEPDNGGASYAAFVKNQLRTVAAGVGLTYEQLTGDLEGVNYSSIRAGLIEVRRRIEQLQWGVLVFQLCRPVWDRWVRLAVLSGAIEAPDFASHPERYAARWVTPGWAWVDPVKDLQAEVLAIRAGLQSRTAAMAGRGLDVEAVDREIAADQARAEALGLDLDFSTGRSGGTASRSPDNADA